MPKNKAKARATGGPKKKPKPSVGTSFAYLVDDPFVTGITVHPSGCSGFYFLDANESKNNIYSRDTFTSITIHPTVEDLKNCHTSQSESTLHHSHREFPSDMPPETLAEWLKNYFVINEDGSERPYLRNSTINHVIKNYAQYQTEYNEGDLSEGEIFTSTNNAKYARSAITPTLFQHTKCMQLRGRGCSFNSNSNSWDTPERPSLEAGQCAIPLVITLAMTAYFIGLLTRCCKRPEERPIHHTSLRRN